MTEVAETRKGSFLYLFIDFFSKEKNEREKHCIKTEEQKERKKRKG
jgi:hypothetical protein